MKSQMPAIHVGLKQLGITEDDKRALYMRVTGKSTLTVMTSAELDKIVQELRRLGFNSTSKRANGKRRLSGKFAKKLQALWISAYNLGIVRLRDDAALEAFVTRQTGISAERFLHNADDARKVVEALKAWMTREASIHWDKAPVEWLAADGAKIAWAQWKLLNPGADLVNRKGFELDVFRVLGVGANGWLAALTTADWQIVMNHYGDKVRAIGGKKAKAA